MKRILVNIIRNVYICLSYKLNQRRGLRKFIYEIYELIRFVEFKLKNLFLKKFTIEYIIHVNPEKIIYQKNLQKGNWLLFLKFIQPLLNIRFNYSMQVINGNWDLKENLQLFNENIKYKSYYQHFIEGVEWKYTEYYKREKKRYLDGKVRKEYKSIEDLDLKYRYFDKLYRKIEREGFKSQREIIKSEGIITNHGRGVVIRKPGDDIAIAIGRNGELIFLDGRHRLNIVKMLYIQNRNIKKIPVRVLVIHPEFISSLEKKSKDF